MILINNNRGKKLEKKSLAILNNYLNINIFKTNIKL